MRRNRRGETTGSDIFWALWLAVSIPLAIYSYTLDAHLQDLTKAVEAQTLVLQQNQQVKK